jgi:hypothetical protein
MMPATGLRPWACGSLGSRPPSHRPGSSSGPSSSRSCVSDNRGAGSRTPRCRGAPRPASRRC